VAVSRPIVIIDEIETIHPAKFMKRVSGAPSELSRKKRFMWNRKPRAVTARVAPAKNRGIPRPVRNRRQSVPKREKICTSFQIVNRKAARARAAIGHRNGLG
jgi:hypothetical protein